MSANTNTKGGDATVKGRKPVPTAIKEAKGTLRKDRQNFNEAKFDAPDKMPKPPTTLHTEGKKLWKLFGPILLERGLFSEGDAIAFEMLCQSYGTMVEARKKIKEDGLYLTSPKGYTYVHPANGVANTAWTQVQKMLGEFGLTPAERSRVMATLKSDTQVKRKALADFLFEGIENGQ